MERSHDRDNVIGLHAATMTCRGAQQTNAAAEVVVMVVVVDVQVQVQIGILQSKPSRAWRSSTTMYYAIAVLELTRATWSYI